MNGEIVWVNGPFPCGNFPDITIFSIRIKQHFDADEYVIGDVFYRDIRCIPSLELISFKF